MSGLDKCTMRQQHALLVAPSWHASSRFPYVNGRIETGESGPPN